jgi:hypothetical protein
MVLGVVCGLLCVCAGGLCSDSRRGYPSRAVAVYPRPRPLFIVAVHDLIRALAKRLIPTPFVRSVKHEIGRVSLPAFPRVMPAEC